MNNILPFRPIENDDAFVNQELECLEIEAAQVRQFLERSPSQREVMLMCGRYEGVAAMRRMMRALGKLAEHMPASSWE